MVKFTPTLNSVNRPAKAGFLLAKKHILTVEQFSKGEIEKLFAQAALFENLHKLTFTSDKLKGRIIANLFYEPSTRARFSFETAAQDLGAAIISAENSSFSSSAIKGESLEDTIQIVEKYSDAIVLRHPEIGSATRAASVAQVPIINAGDGAGAHPTQALLDLYTIQKELGRLTKLKIAIVGDLLHGRAARSFCKILTKFGRNKLFLVSPPSLRMGKDVKDFLKRKGTILFETENLDRVISKIDVLYMTRIQKERFEDENAYLELKGFYKLTLSLVKKMKIDSIIMHPLPRAGEIDPEVDSNRRAAYFRQAANGIPIRMAILASMLG